MRPTESELARDATCSASGGERVHAHVTPCGVVDRRQPASLCATNGAAGLLRRRAAPQCRSGGHCSAAQLKLDACTWVATVARAFRLCGLSTAARDASATGDAGALRFERGALVQARPPPPQATRRADVR